MKPQAAVSEEKPPVLALEIRQKDLVLVKISAEHAGLEAKLIISDQFRFPKRCLLKFKHLLSQTTRIPIIV